MSWLACLACKTMLTVVSYSEAAFEFLERYQTKYRMFNDDIQG